MAEQHVRLHFISWTRAAVLAVATRVHGRVVAVACFFAVMFNLLNLSERFTEPFSFP